MLLAAILNIVAVAVVIIGFRIGDRYIEVGNLVKGKTIILGSSAIGGITTIVIWALYWKGVIV